MVLFYVSSLFAKRAGCPRVLISIMLLLGPVYKQAGYPST